MLDYAVAYGIVDTNYARSLAIDDDVVIAAKKQKKGHFPWTDQERQLLWDNLYKVPFVDWILIQEYMGWRPQEMGLLELDNINTDTWMIVGGIKTEAGIQRKVAVHEKIRPLILKLMDDAKSVESKYLLNDKGQTHAGSWKITYDKYANRYNKVIEALNINPNHRPHDPRSTFISNAKNHYMDEYALKLFVGHSIHDITETAYTVRTDEWLHAEMAKIE